MFNQSVNRAVLGFLVKLHWMEWMYITDSINEVCFGGILHYIPWSTPWLYFWMKHLWNIVWSKPTVRSFLGNSVDWESGKAPEELLIWDWRSKILVRILEDVADVPSKYRPQQHRRTVMVKSRCFPHRWQKIGMKPHLFQFKLVKKYRNIVRRYTNAMEDFNRFTISEYTQGKISS